MQRTKEKGVEFVYPGLDFYESLENDVRANTIELLRRELKEVPAAERAKSFINARPDMVNANHVIAYLQTMAGVKKVLDKSLEIAGVSDEKRKEIINSFAFDDAMNLALHLMGFAKRIPAEFLDKPEDAHPNPNASTDSAGS